MKRTANRTLLLLAATTAASTAWGQGDRIRELEQVVVYGTQRGAESSTGSRLNLTIAETPATVDIISGDAIRARQDFSVIEAVTRSAGFTNESNPGNGHSSIAARGFRGNNAVTKLFDGTNYYTAAGTITYPFDTWGVERIEVLKGPSSVLYGEGGIGGAINIVPKQPSYEQSGDMRLSLGEYDTTYIGLGYTNGLTDSIAYRFDFSAERSDNHVEPNGESESEMLSAALRWDVSEDLALTARVDSGDQSPMQYFGVPSGNGDFTGFVDQNFNVADGIVRYEDDSVRIRADWDVSNSASLEVEGFYLGTERFWRNSEFYSYDDASGLITRWDPLVLGHDMDHRGVRANVVFSRSPRVRSSLGFEMNDISFARPANFGHPNGVDFGAAITEVDPDAFQPGTLADFTSAPVVPLDSSELSQWALFGETRVELTDTLAFVGGLRYEDTATDYQRLQNTVAQAVDAFTGRLGLVYDVSSETALYGQYATGATHPNSNLVTANGSLRAADMIDTEQLELGIKQQAADGRLEWTVAVFDITRNNQIIDDPDSGDPDDVTVIDEQTSQGIEVGLTYSITPSLQVYGNLASLSAETDTGDTPTFVPEETANVGVAFDRPGGLRFIFDARHVGERFHSSNPIPSYTVLDASVGWSLSDSMRLTAKAANLTDELYAQASYYSSTWLVGRRKSVSVTVDYSF